MLLEFKMMMGVALCSERHPITFADDTQIFITTTEKHNVFAIAQNNGVTVSFEIQLDGPTPLPSALKSAGKLELLFQKIIDGHTLQSWRAEPILLKRVEGATTAIPEVIDIQDQISDLRTGLAKIAAALAEIKEIITDPEI